MYGNRLSFKSDSAIFQKGTHYFSFLSPIIHRVQTGMTTEDHVYFRRGEASSRVVEKNQTSKALGPSCVLFTLPRALFFSP